MPSRRALLWGTGLASLILLAVLAALDVGLTDGGGEGIVGFELAGTRERAREIMGVWGASGRDTARLSLWLDFLYLAAYGAFGALGLRAIAGDAARRGRRRLAHVAGLASTGMVAAAICDAVENVNLLLVLGGHGGGFAPRAAMTFALAKFALVAVALGTAAWWGVARLAGRRRA